MNRISLKVVGAQGQGINSVGEMCAKGLKRSGYCVFGYKEYMSLIKGGHSSYQLDFSDEYIESTETMINVLITFNHHGLEINADEVKEGGVILHQTPGWKFPEQIQKVLDKKKISVVYLPVEEILKKLKAKPILGNVLISSVAWALLGRDQSSLKELVQEQFGHKKDLLELNFKCIEEGFAFKKKEYPKLSITLPEPDKQWSKHMLLTGSEAMGLGLIHGGCRLYAGYPMTPSSQLLAYIANMQNETGMVIKQAEDEITAAQVMSGAMLMGTRAATGTSGGGFDLMTETVSLNGIIENPSVFILAQRPGPATGLPTWTAQGDLLLAIGSAHGEFARLVISVSNTQDCFDLMPEAFNYAEEFQTPVIVMTDKQIAEALYTQGQFDQSKTEIRRGKLITEPKELKKLKGSDRYNPEAKDGISPRWLPGTEAATFCTQGDEHSADGSVDETAQNAIAQMEKRMRKMDALKEALPEPEFFGPDDEEELDLLIVGWGSNKGVVLDALKSPELADKKVGYLHYTYMWPLKTEKLKDLMQRKKRSTVIECNYQGQLQMLLSQEHVVISDSIRKYDGRPFFVDELIPHITHRVS